MNSKGILKTSIIVLAWAAMILMIILPERAMAQSPTDGGSLFGFVYGENQGDPVENDVVKIRRIREQKEYTSVPTDENGYFEIKGIEEGRYILGVSSDGKDFNFEYSILVKGKETGFLSFGLRSDVTDFEYERTGSDGIGVEPFFPEPGGKAVFDISAAESTMVVYGAMCPDPRCLSWWKRFWQWLWRWIRRHRPGR